MVTALIRTYGNVLVAIRMIPWRTTPTPEDYRILRMETTFLSRPVVMDSASLSGNRTRRIVSQGSILYEDLFEPVPLVMQGDKVNVRVRAGSVTLTAEGVAREDGCRGDMIDVSVQGRGERLKARVQNERTVAIPVE
jgi:flagella basal body P-ring formation protein FlgA